MSTPLHILFSSVRHTWRWFYHHSDLTAHTTLFVRTFPLWLLITQRTSLRFSLSLWLLLPRSLPLARSYIATHLLLKRVQTH